MRWSILYSTLSVSHTNIASEYRITTTSTTVFHCYSLYVQGIHLFQILYEFNSICCKTVMKKPRVKLPTVNKEKQITLNSSPLRFLQKHKVVHIAKHLFTIISFRKIGDKTRLADSCIHSPEIWTTEIWTTSAYFPVFSSRGESPTHLGTETTAKGDFSWASWCLPAKVLNQNPAWG